MKTSIISMSISTSTPPIAALFLWLFLVATCINLGCCSFTETKGGNCRESEREALLKIKNDLIDPSDRLASWAVGDVAADCCGWYGVICDNSTGHVTELHLLSLPYEYYQHDYVVKERSSFGGKISPFMLNLTHLRYLDLSNNEFHGIRIPEFIGSMKSLTYLNLSKIYFGGPIPPQLGNLTNLLYLDLSKGETYHSPSENVHWLSGLSSLKFLDLSGHNLNKSLDWTDVITTLSSLQELHLSGCQLSPQSNPQILSFNLSSLSILDLSQNALSGSIVSWISHLKHLKSLNLESAISFHGCSIPPEFQNLTYLTQLDLSSNGINSSIPNWLYDFSNLELLNLAENDLQGEISDAIGNMTSLINLDLSSNSKLVGRIPTSFRNLSNLRILSLQFVNLSQEVNQMFENLLGYGSNILESLILRNCQIFGNWVTKDLGRFKSLASLDLQSNAISGPIPMSVGELKSLTTLFASGNSFSSSIPTSLVELKTLRYLDLSYNQLNGNLPNNLGNLKELEIFYINVNLISGPIPTSLGQMRSLEIIDFSSNKLNGTLPNSFENLRNLTEVHMNNNSISGPIPTSFGELSSLNTLDLSINKLNGTLSESFGRLSDLQSADISHNSMEGDVSEIHFANLSSLTNLFANGNKLNLKVRPDWTPPPRLETLELGSWNVGPQFPTWLPSMKSLTRLDLSNSGISISLIPVWFWSWSSQLLYLDISHNNIQGVLPNKLKLPGVTDLSSNHFQGSLPIVTSYQKVLDLSNNSFSGSISNFLCDKTHGMMEMLNLQNNLLVGEIPNCWNTSGWGKLTFLKLSSNKFNGSIPESIGSLSKLESLHLNNNILSGEVPSSLGSCIELVTLDIGGNKLEGNIGRWIGETLSNLVVLNLGRNNFEGSIPRELCRAASLHILDLSNNNLSSTIPKCLNNFSGMAKMDELSGVLPIPLPSSGGTSSTNSLPPLTESVQILIKGAVSEYSSILGFVKHLDLSNNRLSGEIPDKITSLKGLLSLNLSHNSLTGRIPKDIGSMSSLNSLDLHDNQLCCEIPESISRLSFLGHLNLSHNNLSGRIPSGTQIQTFDPSSFMGNELCGKPLTDNCSDDGTGIIVPSKENGNGSDSHAFEVKWFYVTVALGFIFGFWGVVGPLFVNRNLRIAYFSFLQRIEGKIYVLWYLM